MDAQKFSTALERQRDIYLKGAAGRRPAIPVSAFELEKKAAASLPAEAAAYIFGGAGAEATMAANRSAFDRWKIVPRMMCDVSQADLSAELFGQKWPSPLLASPVGVLELAHPGADLAVARALSSLGLPMVFSSQASFPMEKTAAAMGDAPRWMQLYWSKNDALVASFAKRAEDCGCTAIVLTADTTMLGWRARDLGLASLPFLKGMGIANYTSDPVFQELLDEPEAAPAAKPVVNFHSISTLFAANRRHPGPFFANLKSGRGLRAVRKFIEIYANPALNWRYFEFLRKQTRLPILLKGIQHPDDARLAIETGFDGIWASNHGGRQVDGAIGSLAALPAIAEIVKKRAPIIFDSGVRTGADVFKALALGATAVGIGRPYCCGLALGCEEGVREVMRNLLAEFELTTRLSGCQSVAEIGPGSLVLD